MSEKHWMSILLDRLYSQFLYRDLVYVGGGILILAVPFRVYCTLQDLIKPGWWVFVVWFLIAYALGFFAMHVGIYSRVFKMFPMCRGFVCGEVDAIRNEMRVAEEWSEAKLLLVARVSFLKHISAVLGSSSGIALALLVFYKEGLKLSAYSWWLALVVLGAVLGVMIWRNHTATAVEAELFR